MLQFLTYGWVVFRYYGLSHDERASFQLQNPMCEVFPRIASCNFVQYGTGGRQENQNAICVLSLNMINDKVNEKLFDSQNHCHSQVFFVLWLWYFFLLLCSLHRLVYRLSIVVSPFIRFRVLNSRYQKCTLHEHNILSDYLVFSTELADIWTTSGL